MKANYNQLKISTQSQTPSSYRNCITPSEKTRLHEMQGEDSGGDHPRLIPHSSSPSSPRRNEILFKDKTESTIFERPKRQGYLLYNIKEAQNENETQKILKITGKSLGFQDKSDKVSFSSSSSLMNEILEEEETDKTIQLHKLKMQTD